MHTDPPDPPLLRRVGSGHWQALDRLAALAWALPTLLLLTGHARGIAGWLALPIGAVLFTVPITWRRRHPVTALAVLIAGIAVVGALEPRSIVLGFVPLAYVLYVVATTCRPRTAVFGLLACVATAVATVLPSWHHGAGAVIFGTLYIIVWMVGFLVGMHRRYTANLLTSQAERAQRGVMEQRLRIARELHDVLAHHLSVITVQAGYGGLILDQQPDRPEQARAALDAIEDAGRQSLDELRRLVGVLRTAETGARAETEPAPGLADLDRLTALTGQAGVRVDLAVTGQPRPLPAGIDLSAYRIIQEALTNVVKHAAVTSARALVDYRDDQLVIEVSDEGPGRPDADSPGGQGLVGMRERVALYGGELHAGRQPGRGFKVTARLPLPIDVPA